MRGPKVKPLLDNPPVELNPPSWMSLTQKNVWRTIVKNAPVGLLTRADCGVLTTLVVASDLHREACEQARDLDLVVASPLKELPMQNVYLPMINKQAAIMIKASGELGLTPIGRARLKIAKQLVAAKPAKVKSVKAAPAPRVGKKEQATADAASAQMGTDWDSLLPSNPTQ